MVTLRKFFSIIRVHAFCVRRHGFSTLQFRLERVTIKFTSKYGLSIKFLTSLNLSGNGSERSVIRNAEKILIYFLGSFCILMCGTITI